MLESFATKAPDPPHWTLNTCFGAFRTCWVLLGPFCCLTKLISKWAEMVQLMQKFVPWSRVGIFHNERTRSTTLYPKLMFWCFSYSLGEFGTILFPYETRFKTSRTGAVNARIRAMKSCWNLTQQTHPIHSIGPLLTAIISRFGHQLLRINWALHCWRSLTTHFDHRLLHQIQP